MQDRRSRGRHGRPSLLRRVRHAVRGLFSQEGVTSLATKNAGCFGGGFGPVGIQLLGVAGQVGGVAVLRLPPASCGSVLMKTIGIRVTRERNCRAVTSASTATWLSPDCALVAESAEGAEEQLQRPSRAAAGSVPAASAGAVPVEEAVPVVHREHEGAKITKVTVLMNQTKFTDLQEELDRLGITGLTVTNVFGYGAQKGHTVYFRGNPVSSRLLPKVKIEIVVCKLPVDTLIHTIQKTLYTGSYGDGKIFLYDVEDVVKIRTGERGFDALQDEAPADN